MLYICLMLNSIPFFTDRILLEFSEPNLHVPLYTFYYSLYKYLSMNFNDLAHIETMRKAQRCATLYELLCETLGLEPLSPTTTWRDVAKVYSITMEDAFKLQNPTQDETTKD